MSKLDINWDSVGPMYQYAAQDADGDIFLYSEKPTLYSFGWADGGDYEFLECIKNPNWRNNLTERPRLKMTISLPVLMSEAKGDDIRSQTAYNAGLQACAKALEEQGFQVEFDRES